MGIVIVLDELGDLVTLGLDELVGFFPLGLDLVILGTDEFEHRVGLFSCGCGLLLNDGLELGELRADERFQFAYDCVNVSRDDCRRRGRGIGGGSYGRDGRGD